jgi:3-deoxy-D-manno-octulosonic-acid transferase
MRSFYNFAIAAFPLVLRMIAPFHQKAKLMVDGRRGWETQVRNAQLKDQVVWFHCASLGEFEQGRPIIESIKSQFPEHQILVTFFSSSGFEIRKDYAQADLVLYLPFDNHREVKRYLDLIQPKLVVFVKYEFWYNYLLELKSRNIPTFLVSGIFRQDQKFFKKGWTFFADMLSCFTHFYVQNEASERLLNSIGLQNVTVSGDTRFDRVKQICSKPSRIEIAERFSVEKHVMVIGSSWPDDMEVLYPLINQPELDMKYIIAPHEIGSAKIQKLVEHLKCDYQLFSEANPDTIAQAKVLIIDNIGMLSSLYQYGDVAYIGGAFGEGLHNILEAATFGMPIIFGKGKDNDKYQEAIDLVSLGGAFEIQTSMDMIDQVKELMNSPGLLHKASEISATYVDSNAGATQIFMNDINPYLK